VGRADRLLTRVNEQRWVLPVVIFALALAVRLRAIVNGGGLTDNYGYDPSVYYTAGDALSHGLLPYRGEFVLVHPPLIAVFALPFAILGRLTTDPIGYAAANCASCAIGAASAVLVLFVARRWTMSPVAAAVGAACYAVWIPAIYAESTFRLEPLGNLLFLLGLWALANGRNGSTRGLLVCGVCFGLLVNVKILWIAPVLVVLALTAFERRNRRLATVPLATAAATAALIDLPLLALTGPRIIRSVVTSQLHRPPVQGLPGGGYGRLPIFDRLQSMTGVGGLASLFRPASEVPLITAVRWGTVAACALAVAVCVIACRVRVGRVFVAVAAVHVIVLFAAPVYFGFYAGFLAVPMALVVAAALSAPRTRLSPVLLIAPAAWATAIAVSIVAAYANGGARLLVPPLTDPQALASATAGIRCIQSDSPSVLIALNALDRSFTDRCQNWVDFQGVGHGAGPDPAANVIGFRATPAYRRQVARYLRSGDAVVIQPGYPLLYLGKATLQRLKSGPLIAREGDIAIYRTSHGAGRGGPRHRLRAATSFGSR
jgi:hypothetical protein